MGGRCTSGLFIPSNLVPRPPAQTFSHGEKPTFLHGCEKVWAGGLGTKLRTFLLVLYTHGSLNVPVKLKSWPQIEPVICFVYFSSLLQRRDCGFPGITDFDCIGKVGVTLFFYCENTFISFSAQSVCLSVHLSIHLYLFVVTPISCRAVAWKRAVTGFHSVTMGSTPTKTCTSLATDMVSAATVELAFNYM